MDAITPPNYVQVVLEQLQSMLSCLDTSIIDRAYQESVEHIEHQFEECVNSLALRKSELLHAASLLHDKEVDRIKRQIVQVNETIRGCECILEGGKMLLNNFHTVTEAVWKNVASEFRHPHLEEGIIQFDFDTKLLDDVKTHGKVSVDLRRIPRTSPGILSTFASFEKSEEGLYNPSNILVNPHEDSSIYIIGASSSGHVIKRISKSGEQSVIVSNGSEMTGMVVDNHGSIFVIEKSSNSIKKIEVNKHRLVQFVQNRHAFRSLNDITINRQTGDFFVSDTGNHCVHKISDHGDISMLYKGAIDFNPTKIRYCERSKFLYVCDGPIIRLISVVTGALLLRNVNVMNPVNFTLINDGTLLITTGDNTILTVDSGGTKLKQIMMHREAYNSQSLFQPAGITFADVNDTCYFTDIVNNCVRTFTFV